MGPTEQKATIYYIKCRYIRKRKLVQFVQYSCKDQKAYNKKMNGNKSGERAHKRAEDDANAIAIVIVKYIQQSAGQKNEKKTKPERERGDPSAAVTPSHILYSCYQFDIAHIRNSLVLVF